MRRRLLLVVLMLLFFYQESISQTEFQKPALEDKDSWSMILVPDIQNYVKWNRNQPILDLMMRWIEDNIEPLNIKMVICVGDLVEQNDLINPGHDGDQSAEKQWQFSAQMFGRLDGKVPYVAATGNHDYSIDRLGNRTSRYNDFFPVDKNWLNKKLLVQNATNEQGIHTIENAAFELNAPNGQKYLFMTIEYAPRDTILSWAKNITQMDQYKNHRIVLTTHSYLTGKDMRTSGAPKWFVYEPYFINNVVQKSKRINLPNANSGEQIWKKLVEPSENIELVLCGHISGEGYRIDDNINGKAVHQILFDSQSLGGGHRNGNGGDGWLRIFEFKPDNKTVKVKTYSPLFAISPSTQQFAWKNDSRNEYTFTFSK